MSLSAQVVAELVAAGLAGQALVDACRRIEAAGGATVARNGRKNATVVKPQDATVVPGAGAGRAPLAMVRAAIANHTGLTRGAARVGAAILDRFDPRTGRCEVGIDSIARVCGLHRASVFRAVATLVAAGLLRRTPYGGMGHCNAYAPRWEAIGLTAPAAEGRENATVAAMRRSQGCDPISERYITPSGVKGGAVGRRRSRGVERLEGQRELLGPHLVATAPDFSPTPQVVRDKAVMRLVRDHNDQHKGRGFSPGLRPDPEIWEAAIAAEVRVHGSGLATLNRLVMAPLEESRGPVSASPELRRIMRRSGSGPP